MSTSYNKDVVTYLLIKVTRKESWIR